MRKIKERIGQIAIETIDKMSSRIRFIRGTVKEIDEEERELTLLTPEGAEIGQVMLQSMSNKESSMVIYPKQGSDCIILFEEESNSGCVIATEEVERVELVIGETRVEVTEDGIVLNGGELGGMVKVEALTAKLNELIDAFNNHSHTLPSGAVAVTGSASAQSNELPITVPAIASKHAEVKRGDYENEKVKQ